MAALDRPAGIRSIAPAPGRRSGNRAPAAPRGGASRPGGGASVIAPLAREQHGPDMIILVTVVALTALGILMVYSSTALREYARNSDTLGTVGPQFLWAAVGFVALFVLMRVDFRWLRLVSLPGLLVALAMLLLIHVPELSVNVGGSSQWLRIPGLGSFQPGEAAKLALVVYLAHWLARRGSAVRGFRSGLVPFVVIVAPLALLVFVSPDLGTTTVIGATAIAMLFVAGGNPLHLLGLAATAATAALVFMKDYQLARLQAFGDPFRDAAGTGYQSVQGLLALGIGGLFGAGLGETAAAGGIVLPEAYNDYIFGIIGQELGFMGATAVVAGFILLAWRGIRIALAAPDTFGALLATGITAYLCIQAFINIGVVVTLLPVTGITLPFVSAGGSSLIVSLVAVGILLSVSRETVARGGVVDASADRGRRYGRAHLPGPRRRPIAPRATGRA